MSLQEVNTLMDAITTQSTGIDASSESIGQRIVMTVADEIDADPIELEPLYETIDPEAIDQLFHANAGAETDQRSRIVFTYAGCEVTVYENDELDVTRLAEGQPTAVIGEPQQTIQSN